MKELMKDPLNLIVIGVGGQGNVVTSSIICEALLRDGYIITFGQTYPAQQRGGSVINFIRVSREYQASPIIPHGRADIIVGMEPVEALRMLREYGNPDVHTMVNPRPIHSVDIALTKTGYPSLDELMETIGGLSAKTWVIKATENALEMGNSILANVILVGALIGSGLLPLERDQIEPVLKERFPAALETNMKAFDRGVELASRMI
ncbi:MAG: 2-oxoacid:acceptor oxidoreductase family protein [Deltaproteobacteria bacterium]|nr:2-oxoacid:acceptor oxidoreductase family protein [Deltaproteobacteria bacterium]